MSSIVCEALTYRPVTSGLGKPSTSDVSVVGAVKSSNTVTPVPVAAATVWPASGVATEDSSVLVRCFGSAGYITVGSASADPTVSPRKLVDQVSNNDFVNIFVPKGSVIRAIAATIA